MKQRKSTLTLAPTPSYTSSRLAVGGQEGKTGTKQQEGPVLAAAAKGGGTQRATVSVRHRLAQPSGSKVQPQGTQPQPPRPASSLCPSSTTQECLEELRPPRAVPRAPQSPLLHPPQCRLYPRFLPHLPIQALLQPPQCPPTDCCCPGVHPPPFPNPVAFTSHAGWPTDVACSERKAELCHVSRPPVMCATSRERPAPRHQRCAPESFS